MRSGDAEAITIENLKARADTNLGMKGTLDIYVDHPNSFGPCPHCQEYIKWWNESEYGQRIKVRTITSDGIVWDGSTPAPSNW